MQFYIKFIQLLKYFFISRFRFWRDHHSLPILRVAEYSSKEEFLAFRIRCYVLFHKMINLVAQRLSARAPNCLEFII